MCVCVCVCGEGGGGAELGMQESKQEVTKVVCLVKTVENVPNLSTSLKQFEI